MEPPESYMRIRLRHLDMDEECSNVGITLLNRPFANGLYPLSIVIWGIVCSCYTHIILDFNLEDLLATG